MATAMSAGYAADFTDDRVLIGASHNIFVAKVLAQTGNKDRRGVPQTQFAVEVVDNIKGELRGIVTVNQMGGYSGGDLHVVEDGEGLPDENSYLLEPGATYLLAARYNTSENWYTLNSFHSARELITRDGKLTNADLGTLAGANARVLRLRSKYPDEILPDADVANNNARNSYRFFHPAAPSSKTTRDVE